MRWKFGLVGALIAVVASLLVGGGASGSGFRSETIWLYADANEAADTYLPVSGEPPSEETPPSVGDRNISRDDLYVLGGTPDAPAPVGDLVGRNDIDCTFVEVDATVFSARLLCPGVIEKFALGTITWQATIVFSEETSGQPFQVAITGGTGAFANAGGEIIVHEVPSEDELTDSVYEIRLLRFADA